MKRILIIGASPRRGGNSDNLIKNFAKGANEAGVEAEIIQLSKLNISPCIGCEACRKTKTCSTLKDDMTGIYQKIIDSQGLFLISPVHNYNITAWMKAFIDSMYCFYDFTEPRPNGWSSRLANQGRKAVVAGVSEQITKKDFGFTIEAMKMPLEAMGYEVINELAVLGIFDKGAITKHENYLRQAEKLGADLANLI